MPGTGLITIPSPHSVAETVKRLESVVKTSGLQVFARVDHGANARDVNMPLRPTCLVLFGHPKGGTPLMQENQVAGIDLPFKALAWEDEQGKVWLTYNDPAWLGQRHGLGTASHSAIQAIQAGMTRLLASVMQ